MQNHIKPDLIFETSWEVCNLVGGIYTVLSTRAATLVKEHGDNLIFIGPDVWKHANCPYFEEDEEMLADWKKFSLLHFSLPVRVGRWKIPGQPMAILVDFKVLMPYKNKIYGKVWETSAVNSMEAYGDYDDSSMFGYASGMVIESFCRFHKLNASKKIVAHFNEWMTTFGLFYVRENLKYVATVFTTHATSIGRSIAGNHKPLYDYLHEYNGDQMAGELNMVSKHATEKRAAWLADCFTTVSEITARECNQLIEKKPDVVTPNGFENDFIPAEQLFIEKRNAARNLLRKVATTLTGYNIADDALLMVTAGRYEFKNKGIDVFIEALKHLNDNNELKREIVAFVMIPGWHKGYRPELAEALNNQGPGFRSANKLTTHELHDYRHDQVIQCLQWFHLKNLDTDRVKVIFVPAYMNGNDGIFNKTYYDLLIGFDLSVFPSYYEPWGYTPLESVAFHVPTITTDLSGFGNWVSSKPQSLNEGVGIIHRSDYNAYHVTIELAEMIYKFSKLSSDEVNIIRNKAHAIAEKALWKHFIKHYYETYTIALKRKGYN